jgi:EmrB/QacA subfamily drug resistance transporter
MATITESEATRPASRFGPAVTLIVCCTALFMTTLDNTILNVALPALQKNLHASASGLQWTVDSYVLVRASSLFLAGSLGDRFGRRNCFGIGLGAFVVFSAACGLAPNLSMLIFFRCLQGAGSALMTPSSLGIITNTFTDRKKRAQAVGIWSATTGISTTAGPVVGGLLVQYLGWRAVFWVNVPIGVLALIGTRRLSESKSAAPRRFDVPGQLAISVALIALTYALITAPESGWLSVKVLSLLVVSLASLAVFIALERRSASPLLELRYFKNPALSGAVVLAIVAFVANGGFLFFNTLYLQEVRGFSPLHAGALTIPVNAAALFLAPIAGRITGARGPRIPACIGAACICIAMSSLAITVAPHLEMASLLVVYAVLGFGSGFVNPPITNAAVSGMPADRAGVAGAVTSTSRQVGTNLGVALVGSVVFSIASTSGIGHARGKLSPSAGAIFTHALHYGYGLVAVLAFGALLLSYWAFRPLGDRAGDPEIAANKALG